MQTIELAGQWFYTPTKPENYPLDNLRVLHLPQERSETGWLHRTFEMPPNDECSVWWLEGSGSTGDIWLNGMLVGAGTPGQWRLDVTHAVTMEENIIIVNHQTSEQWTSMVLHPYPCQTRKDIHYDR